VKKTKKKEKNLKTFSSIGCDNEINREIGKEWLFDFNK
jgi:hypothetical protein